MTSLLYTKFVLLLIFTIKFTKKWYRLKKIKNTSLKHNLKSYVSGSSYPNRRWEQTVLDASDRSEARTVDAETAL